jgi:hypothetical protein
MLETGNRIDQIIVAARSVIDAVFAAVRHFHFPNDLAQVIQLDAANARPRFTISLKRSTQNLQLSTSSPADYPIFWSKADIDRAVLTACGL